MFVFLLACFLFACLLVRLFVYFLVCLFICCFFACFGFYLFACFFLFASLLSIYSLLASLFVYLLACWFVCLFVCLFVYLQIHHLLRAFHHTKLIISVIIKKLQEICSCKLSCFFVVVDVAVLVVVVTCAV